MTKTAPTEKRKIIFAAGGKSTYPRNANALKMLREMFDVVEITSSAGGYLWRFPIAALKLIFAKKSGVDAIYLGFMGHPLVFLAKAITKKPVIFDVFISLFDSICLERKTVGLDSLPGKLIFWLDKTACRLADVVIVDTAAHARWFSETFSLPPEKIKVFYICADADLFRPAAKTERKGEFVMEFHGGFIPLQGVEHIVKAAKILENRPGIKFRFLGKGMTLETARGLSEKLGLKNVEFIEEFVPIEKVPAFINESDVALGIFGTVGKTFRVIPNKAFEALACGKPLITCQTAAAGEMLKDGENALLCRAGDSIDLADKILKLKNDAGLRRRLAENGLKTFREFCDFNERKERLAAIVLATIKK